MSDSCGVCNHSKEHDFFSPKICKIEATQHDLLNRTVLPIRTCVLSNGSEC